MNAANLHAQFCSDLLGLELDAPATAADPHFVAREAARARAVARAAHAPRAVTEADLVAWLANVQATVVDAYYAAHFPSQFSRLSIVKGRRYAKIVSQSGMNGEVGAGRSVYGFVDMTTGDLYKPASWKQPERNFARGNIFAADPLRGCGESRVG